MNQVLTFPRETAVAPLTLHEHGHPHDPFEPVANPLPKLLNGEDLPSEDSEHLFERLVLGKLEPAEIAGMLIALRMKGETADEMIGAARALSAAALPFDRPDYLYADCCGTGGDGSGLINVSTATAFVAAACGLPVAKHGNRSATSRAGAADVLETLGVKIELSPAQAQRCLEDAGSCFLFARTYHPAMRHVANVRSRLGVRTIFNLLGPLSNPARVKRQLLGVYAREWIEPMAEVLAVLGTEKAWVVHGSDGLDEMTTTGETHIASLNRGQIQLLDFDAVPRRATLADLKGGDARHNANAIKDLLEGEDGAFRDIVVLNAAAALVVADKAQSIAEGVHMAEVAIDSGAALSRLELLVEISNA